MNRIRRSIRVQVWLLFGVIFLFNFVSVGVFFAGFLHNEACVEDIRLNVENSQEISGITAAHVAWVNELSSHLERKTAFTGSLDPATCSFGKWVSTLPEESKADPEIAKALSSIEGPHALIHGKAAEIISLNETNPAAAYDAYEHTILPNVLAIIANLNLISNRYNDLTFASVTSSAALLQRNSIVQLVLIVFVLAVSVVIALLVMRLTIRPIKKIAAAFEEIAKGHLKTSIEYNSRDEMGRMVKLIQQTLDVQSLIMGDLIQKLTKISAGDLKIQIEIDYPGDFSALKTAIEETVTGLNQTMYTIRTAAEQVGTGSEQVSGGAQELASGSAEQAATVEELNATVSEISRQAAENLSSIEAAAGYIDKTGAGVGAGNHHMERLTEAMEEISSSSGQIANITKVIEDIAFQTNILALNAAIEAARAGAAA